MDKSANLNIVSRTCPNRQAIKQMIRLRNLCPICSSEGPSNDINRCVLLSMIFPEVLNKWKLCLVIDKYRQFTLPRDFVLDLLHSTQIDFTRTVELFNTYGSMTYYLSKVANELLSFEPDLDKFLCAANNLSILISEKWISSTARIQLVEQVPDLNNREIMKRILLFKPTCFVFNVPQSCLKKGDGFSVIMESKEYSILELAKTLVTIAPVVFHFPFPPDHLIPFAVEPLLISRKNKVKYCMYALTSVDQVRELAPPNLEMISIKSLTYKTVDEIREAVVENHYIPAYEDQLYEQKIQALVKAFGAFPQSVIRRLAIVDKVINTVNHVEDGVIGHLEDLDKSRVVDLFAGIGENCFAFLAQGSTVMANIGYRPQYACLVNNIIELRAAGYIPEHAKAELTSVPVGMAIENAIKFSPTVFFMSIIASTAQPINGEIIMRSCNTDYTLLEFAKIALMNSAVAVFQLANRDDINVPFYVKPIEILRDGQVHSLLYIVRKQTELIDKS